MSLIYFLRTDLANFYSASRLNVPVGGGDHLVSEALYFNDQKVTALKYIKIVHMKVGNGMVIL